MVDQKLTALTELITPVGTDIIYIVDDPSGTPLSRKITVTNLTSLVGGSPSVVWGNMHGDALSPGTQFYTIPDGKGTENGTEAFRTQPIPIGATFQNMFVNTSNNTRNGDTLFTLRDDSVDTSLVVTVTASTSGTFSDTVNTAVVVAESLVDTKAVLGGASGSLGLLGIGYELT